MATVTTFPFDPAAKTLTGDADGCSFSFLPVVNFSQYKFKQGALVWYSTGVDSTFQLTLAFPGVVASWNLTRIDANTLRCGNGTLNFTFTFTLTRRNRMTWTVSVSARPPADSFAFTPSSSPALTATLRVDGSVDFVDAAGKVVFTLLPLTATDANSRPLGISWGVSAGKLLINLVKADWDGAVYPVTVV